MKKIIIIRPESAEGSPVYERSNSFSDYFKRKGFHVNTIASPDGILDLLKLIITIVRCNPAYVFITMPPFRNWSIFLLPFAKIILDLRDGWSIAIESGYGGVFEPNKKKAKLAKFIEYFAIKKSFATITCTPGLVQYLNSLSKKKIYLVRNGLSQDDYLMAQNLFVNKSFSSNENIRRFICAGKFSEYGKDKVKKILSIINERYGDKKCLIQLIGSDVNENKWIAEYLTEKQLLNIDVEILGRLSKYEMYNVMHNAFCAITIIRDPDYDFGTKIYDYLALELKYLDYFDDSNNFQDYFYQYSDKYHGEREVIQIVREKILEESDFNSIIV